MLLQSPLAVVTGSLDADVLTVLARADARFTVDQIRRILGHGSYEGVRKVLRRLAAQGIVEIDAVGSSYGHSLNRSHLAAEHIIAIAHLRETLLEQMHRRLETWPLQPRWAALFGSAARGEMRVDSDIDIVLVDPAADADLWEEQTGQFAAEVTAWTGNDARILSLSEDELRSGAAKHDPIIESLLADAVTVFGPSDWLRNTVRSQTRCHRGR